MKKFKVGDEVIFTNPKTKETGGVGFEYAKERCKEGQVYTVSYIDDTDLRLEGSFRHLYLNVQQFELKTKTMKKEDFSLEGAPGLRRAFAEAAGLKLASPASISGYNYLTSTTSGGLQGVNAKQTRHFILTTGWDEALAYVKDYYAPVKVAIPAVAKKEVKKAIAAGDYVKIIKLVDLHNGTIGAVFQVARVYNEGGHRWATGNWAKRPVIAGSSWYLTELVHATPAEILAYKAKYEAPKACVAPKAAVKPVVKPIEKPRFRICGYSAEFTPKTVKFGCKTLKAKDVQLLIDAIALADKLEARHEATITAAGLSFRGDTKLTVADLKSILKQIV